MGGIKAFKNLFIFKYAVLVSNNDNVFEVRSPSYTNWKWRLRSNMMMHQILEQRITWSLYQWKANSRGKLICFITFTLSNNRGLSCVGVH
jgi:hypothetical protein